MKLIWFLIGVCIPLVIAGLIIRYNKRNDWKEIYISDCSYTTYRSYDGVRLEHTNKTEYGNSVLLYSKLRNKYKIIETGYIPISGYKTSDAYITCMTEKIRLQKLNNN